MSKCPIMTVEAIRKRRPSPSYLSVFLEHWPDGMPLTKNNWRKLIRLGLDYAWLKCLLSASDGEKYEAAEQSAYEKYQLVRRIRRYLIRIDQAGWKRYQVVTQSALLEALRSTFGKTEK